MKINYFLIIVLQLIVSAVSGQESSGPRQLFDVEKSFAKKEQIYAYYVVERVHLRSGTQITTYEVSDERFISTADLGPNNTRTITPKYRSTKIKTGRITRKNAKRDYKNLPKDNFVNTDIKITDPVNKDLLNSDISSTGTDSKDFVNSDLVNNIPSATDPAISKAAAITEVASNDLAINNNPAITDIATTELESIENQQKYATINIPATYERILKKGYRSEKLLKSVGDEYFFNLDYVNAAKWYSELFALTTNLDEVFYYRYSKSLESINEIEKSKEVMKIFESKNL